MSEIEIKVPWTPPTNPELQQYLKPTDYVDPTHPKIRRLAAELSKGCRTPREAAVNIFYYIVNDVKWEMEPVKSDIETLEQKSGNCFNRANLQISMLRALGIPARYHFVKTGLKLLRAIIPIKEWEKLYEKQKWTIHQSAEVYLGGRWINCDAAIDQDLIPYPYRWNGYGDLLLVVPWFILGYVGSPAVLPVEEINKRFDERGFTFEHCQKNISPFTQSLREMSDEELAKHYKKYIGKRDGDSVARILFFHFTRGHYHSYQPRFRHNLEFEGKAYVLRDGKKDLSDEQVQKRVNYPIYVEFPVG